MSHFRLARLCLLLAAVGLNTAPALMTSAHAQKAATPAAATPANTVRPELAKLLDPAQVQPLLTAKNYAITAVDGSLEVTKAPLTVVVDDKSRTYGSANPNLTASYEGFVLGQVVTGPYYH